jgi:simple sugar transport system permease protein
MPKFNNGVFVGLMLAVLCLVTGLANPAFLSAATLFDTLRSLTVVGILGMGVLLVMIGGGIDVSFPAVAALSSYVSVKVFIGLGWDGPLIAIFGLAVVIGLVLGLINGVLISAFRLPALIVTLATSSLIYGFNLFFMGSQDLFNVPASIAEFSRASLFTATDAGGRSWSLHPLVLLFLAVAALMALFLRYTTAGRGIYALGGSRDAAERVGLPVWRLELLVFATAGVLAAIAGMCQVVFFRNANPGALNGSELDVIAAVVLGGVSVTGGKGGVGGALLGLTFVTIMTTSLIMLGIPAEWQKVFVGVALLLGISLAAYRVKRAETRAPIPFSRMDDESEGSAI